MSPVLQGQSSVSLAFVGFVSLTRRRSVKFRLQASTTGGHKDLVGPTSVCVLATVCVFALWACLKVGSRPTDTWVAYLFIQQHQRDVGPQHGHDAHSLAKNAACACLAAWWVFVLRWRDPRFSWAHTKVTSQP